MGERPILFAMLSAIAGVFLTTGVLWWAESDPEGVVIGLPGRHDSPTPDALRLADCLDCHVPFVGTPGSRCLGPGCHGDLATGTPPKDGPAMPIRFHDALRDQRCGTCHDEHVEKRLPREFAHGIIPQDVRGQCHRCHSAATVESHARTDTIACNVCHGFDTFKGTAMVHAKVAKNPCDVCHDAPKNEAHATVAGACTDCHSAESWKPNDPW